MQDPTDDERIRAWVREMLATPDGREVLTWFNDLPADKFEVVVRRLNHDVNPPGKRMTDEEIRSVVDFHVQGRSA